ncbi:RNA polymerase sigma factor SigM [Rhodococcoides yunnanense]|uniref:RNA polymerase sigma factor SigM n=1 Tax=Rhodococcoides yunnanense TaxID=278209 RepID=UPI001114DDB6|nr:RNA polymerase sigma factor SigM [Rhodococcus yunnanensis]
MNGGVGGLLSGLSDVELLNAHVRGDPDAFTALVHRHHEHLWMTARRTSYTTEDAADALQEALLSAHRTAGSFRADAAVRSWMHKIVVNACLDRIRRNRSRPTTSLTDADVQEPTETRDRISDLETSIEVHNALMSLPPEQRSAVVAVDMEGYSVADAAAILGVPTGTVKSRCARGRLKLAVRLRYLQEEGNR